MATYTHPPTTTRSQVVDAFHLEVRCMVLEIAAILDRYDRAPGGADGPEDPRWTQCREALTQLSQPSDHPDRAERIALAYSEDA